MQDYDFNKVSLQLDGVNTKISDLDFYEVTKEVLNKNKWNFDYSQPSYFRKSPYNEIVN